MLKFISGGGKMVTKDNIVAVYQNDLMDAVFTKKEHVVEIIGVHINGGMFSLTRAIN